MSVTRVWGYEWNTHPRGLADVLLCLVGQHDEVQHGIDDGLCTSRCSCGAIRIGRNWSRPDKLGLRRGTPVPIDIKVTT